MIDHHDAHLGPVDICQYPIEPVIVTRQNPFVHASDSTAQSSTACCTDKSALARRKLGWLSESAKYRVFTCHGKLSDTTFSRVSRSAGALQYQVCVRYAQDIFANV